MESKTPNGGLEGAASAQYRSWANHDIPAEEMETSKALAASLNDAPTSSSLNNCANTSLPLWAEDGVTYQRQDSAVVKVHGTESGSDLQAAIELSLGEADIQKHTEEDLKWDRFLNGEDASDKKGKSPETSNGGETIMPPSLEDRIQDLSLNGVSKLALMYDPCGDTFVYLDPPAQQPEQDENSYFRYTLRYKTPMLMRKRTLLSFDSSFFQTRFGPTYQHRIIRRRRLVGMLPPSVKYVIDLTPPEQDEEAVFLMTELCCSDGVRKWFLASHRWDISDNLVGGREDWLQNPNRTTASNASAHYNTIYTGQVQRLSSTGSRPSQDTIATLPLAYSPISHRSAIERVLAAMQGLDPKLDSAPKVWTTFAVAKNFGIIHSPLTDYIVSWLRATPNSYFLEVMPEVSLKIADGLQCHDLCRDVFAILIGEEALATFHRRADKDFDCKLSVYGRKRDDVPELYQTGIEYASKAFADRIMGEFTLLVDDNMSWLECLPEFQKLALDGPLSLNAANELLAVRSMLQLYVRGAIYKVLCTNYSGMPSLDEGQAGVDDLFPRESWGSIWTTLLPHERILTRSFWNALKACDLLAGSTNFDIGGAGHQFWPMSQITAVEEELRKCGTMESVITADMECMVAKLNQWSIFNSKGPEESVEDNNLGKGLMHRMPWRHMNLPSRNSKTKNDVPEPELGSTSSDCPSVDYWWEHDSADNLLPAKKNLSNLIAAQLAMGPKHHSAGESSRAVGMELEGHLFSLPKFLSQAKQYLETVTRRMLAMPDAATRMQTLELGLTNTLVCLTSSEWKVLPLWAGGNNDGTGGVFEDDVPLSHSGFSTAGPRVRTVSSPPSSSDFTIVNSTTTSNEQTSLQTNDGLSSTLPFGRVVSTDGESILLDDHRSTHRGTNPLSEGNGVTEEEASTGTLDSDYTLLTPVQPEDNEDETERAERLISNLEEEEKSSDLADKEKKDMDVGEDYNDVFGYDCSSDEKDDNDEYDLEDMIF